MPLIAAAAAPSLEGPTTGPLDGSSGPVAVLAPVPVLVRAREDAAADPPDWSAGTARHDRSRRRRVEARARLFVAAVRGRKRAQSTHASESFARRLDFTTDFGA
jgi:hypothetical protein